ncbi:MAG: asparagine synthase (glutamine-hydrolyzing) [Ignavibacteria bacterium]
MCGFAGILNTDKRIVNRQVVVDMANQLNHRGPDSEGYYVKENIGLGHKRLSILDLSENGNQPMVSKDGKYVIVYNGCVYNFKELRAELEKESVVFKSNGDTEVILEGMAKFGFGFVERLNGMFAFALWNVEERKLTLVRDRFGVKPLYYWNNGKSFVFASEIKGILKHPDYKISLNKNALNEYFTFQNLFSDNTLFSDIKLLPAGYSIFVNSNTGDVQEKRWWDFNFSEPNEKLSFEDAKEETMNGLRNAVTSQLVSDVPLGAYLSGGMDSGSITAIASAQMNRLYTFTCGFDMSAVTGVEMNYDERKDAELIANHFNTEQYELVINAGDLKWSLPKVVWHLEDLRVGMSYPNYYISKLASKFVKVCLQGTGGDELFGGYPWRYYRVFQSLSKNEFFENYYAYWQRLVPDSDKTLLFQENVLKSIDINSPKEIFKSVFDGNNKLSYNSPEQHIQNSLYFEIKTFLNGLLIVGDKLSMAHSLEERYPFLDNNLVDIAQSIPVRHKLSSLENEITKINENALKDKKRTLLYKNHDDGKNVLRKAMTDFVPERILSRKKQGFSAPDESWYRGENANYVKELLLNKDVVSFEFIDKKYIERIIDEHMNNKANHRLLIWSFLNFEWWCRIFLNGEKVN